MQIFSTLEEMSHEQVVFFSDPGSNLKAIVAIHDTTLGPALGGCRFWPYATEQEALLDVLRLSRAMTYKAAAAGLNLGGGKAVIIGDSRKLKSEALFRAYGSFVEGLGGRYITAEDVGTSVDDMEFVRMETRYVTGIARALGGSGDPAPVTALGVFRGMEACLVHRFGDADFGGRKVAIQGLGHVGTELAALLTEAGAKLHVTDIDERPVKKAVQRFGAVAVAPDEIYDVECDVFAPCALGGTVNDRTLPRLRCPVIAGAANNQLEDEASNGELLQKLGIVYAPDFVINAGGLINVANEIQGYNREKALTEARGIYDIVLQILRLAEEKSIPTQAAAGEMAESRIASIGRIKRRWGGTNTSFRSRRLWGERAPIA
jgi:leucine dehydrogenase